MAGRFSVTLLGAAIRNLKPRTKKAALFWLGVVAVTDAAFVVFDGQVWLAAMLSATILFIVGVEVSQEVGNYINNRPWSAEESLGQTLSRYTPIDLPLSRDGQQPQDYNGQEGAVVEGGEPTAAAAATVAEMTVADGGVAAVGEAAAEAGADAAGEVVAEVIGNIISG